MRDTALRLSPLIVLALIASPCAAADVAKGGQLYSRHCAGCHGANGVPVMPGAPNLTRPEAMMRSDGSVAAVIRTGRMSMPGFRGILKDSEVYDVIAFMRTLIR